MIHVVGQNNISQFVPDTFECQKRPQEVSTVKLVNSERQTILFLPPEIEK